MHDKKFWQEAKYKWHVRFPVVISSYQEVMDVGSIWTTEKIRFRPVKECMSSLFFFNTLIINKKSLLFCTRSVCWNLFWMYGGFGCIAEAVYFWWCCQYESSSRTSEGQAKTSISWIKNPKNFKCYLVCMHERWSILRTFITCIFFFIILFQQLVRCMPQL